MNDPALQQQLKEAAYSHAQQGLQASLLRDLLLAVQRHVSHVSCWMLEVAKEGAAQAGSCACCACHRSEKPRHCTVLQRRGRLIGSRWCPLLLAGGAGVSKVRGGPRSLASC